MECGDFGSLKRLWRHLFSLLKPKAAEKLESPEIMRKRLCVCMRILGKEGGNPL